MSRRRPGGNFGNFGASSFSNIDKPEIKKFKLAPVKGEFGGSVPDSLYTSNRESTWSRWRRGWELGAANGVLRPFFYNFEYNIPFTSGQDIIGGRSPIITGAIQGFASENKELGMQWCGVTRAGNLRFDNLEDQQGVRLAVSGEAPPDQLFLGKAQDNANYWYIQLSGTFSSVTISGISGPLPPPLFVELPDGRQAKPINGDTLEDTILTVSGTPIDKETRDPQTGRRFGFVQAILVNVDQYQGILQIEKLGSTQSTLDAVLQTPSRIPFESGRFLQLGARYCCTCQDFTRRNYTYLSSLGVRKRPLFFKQKAATVKPGRYEEIKLRNSFLNAAQTEIISGLVNNRLLTVIYPSGEPTDFETPEVAISESGKDARDPKTLYRQQPEVFDDFGGLYRRGFGDNPNPNAVAEGLAIYGDYKQSGDTITEITDNWTFSLDQYRYCKHIYAMRYADGVFPNEPSDFPVEIGLISEWEDRLIEKTRNEQSKSFQRLTTYGISYMDVPPYNFQSPMVFPMIQRLINIPTEFIQLQNFVMLDKDNQRYAPVSGELPTSAGNTDNYEIKNWDFPIGTNY